MGLLTARKLACVGGACYVKLLPFHEKQNKNKQMGPYHCQVINIKGSDCSDDVVDYRTALNLGAQYSAHSPPPPIGVAISSLQLVKSDLLRILKH